MATNNYYNLHEDAGAVWYHVNLLWQLYVEHETWTFGHTWTTRSNGSQDFLALKITITTDTDTDNYELTFLDTPVFSGTGKNPPHYVMSRPAFGYGAPVMAPSYGARDTIADYNSNMHPIKLQILVHSCNASDGTDSYVDGTGFDGWVANRTYQTLFTWYYGAYVLVDYIAVNSGDLKLLPGNPGYNPLMYGLAGAPQAGGGGGSTDLTPVVDAIDNLAMVDYNTSINNGAQMWSMRGRVRVS